MRKTISGVLVGAVALACVIGTSTKADAALFAAICDDLACAGGNDFIVLDNNGNTSGGGAATDTIGAVGAISFGTSAFGYSLVVNTTQSKPMLGSAASPQLDVTFTATTSNSNSNSVFLYASDTDFLGATVHPFLLTFGGTNSGGSGTATGRAWGGTSNTALQFSGANLFGTVGPLSNPAFAGSVGGTFTSVVSPFSLTIGVAINRTSAGTTTGDLNLSPSTIPEPASMALLGLGLMGFGAVKRIHKGKQVK
ncbi:PEP-CTERM motif [Luteitalea pratensis]|uniref:PEP-CTERM motif n=2 Tax=Luteitalea pratensis TaxID=1855912 RepID=A0A143PQC0_LUTPR|nr:PEP-CTERM motif [Luteitalea pratensis]